MSSTLATVERKNSLVNWKKPLAEPDLMCAAICLDRLGRAKTLPRRTRSILSETGKDLAKENEKNPLRFGPAQSRRRPQRLRDQRPEARTSSTSSFRDSRYSGRARNPAKQHERAVTIRRFLFDSCFRQADLTEDVHLLKDTSYVAGLPASLCDRL
ncbi:unnamed protein product [Pleuronectes platessa]|uniref:Uncharacterized protein n=1 Tax=Pleuronectes platessa TaxID=8262 RepID=A0A9N7Z706_PLEPL|nr:unnamed protein product [Pleuronectes platessa]